MDPTNEYQCSCDSTFMHAGILLAVVICLLIMTLVIDNCINEYFNKSYYLFTTIYVVTLPFIVLLPFAIIVRNDDVRFFKGSMVIVYSWMSVLGLGVLALAVEHYSKFQD